MSQEILQQYLLSQTSILEYLPRNKLAKVTQLPANVLDQFYDQLAGFDDNIQCTVEQDIEGFVSELGPLIQTVIEEAQLQQENQENHDTTHVLLQDDNVMGSTVIDDSKLDDLSNAVARELMIRHEKRQKERETILEKIEKHASRVNKRKVEVAYDFSGTVNRSRKKLMNLESRLNKIDFD